MNFSSSLFFLTKERRKNKLKRQSPVTLENWSHGYGLPSLFTKPPLILINLVLLETWGPKFTKPHLSRPFPFHFLAQFVTCDCVSLLRCDDNIIDSVYNYILD